MPYATSFSSFNITCSKFVALKENTLTYSFQNHYSNLNKHPPRFSLKVDQDLPRREGIGRSPYNLKLTAGYHSHQKIEPPCFFPRSQTTDWNVGFLLSKKWYQIYFHSMNTQRATNKNVLTANFFETDFIIIFVKQ